MWRARTSSSPRARTSQVVRGTHVHVAAKELRRVKADEGGVRHRGPRAGVELMGVDAGHPVLLLAVPAAAVLHYYLLLRVLLRRLGRCCAGD